MSYKVKLKLIEEWIVDYRCACFEANEYLMAMEIFGRFLTLYLFFKGALDDFHELHFYGDYLSYDEDCESFKFEENGVWDRKEFLDYVNSNYKVKDLGFEVYLDEIVNLFEKNREEIINEFIKKNRPVVIPEIG